MHVLIVGGGGREHAIAWALSKSSKVDHLSCAPGNGGTIVCAGTPEEVAACEASYTGQYLKRMLK